MTNLVFRLVVVCCVLAAGWMAGAQSFSAHAAPAIVIEPASGLVLYEEEPDRLWHPASLTKLMTAYMTFQAIRDGKLSLEDHVVCSPHALEQAPSKVGLPIGGQMSIETALKALIVKSANDVAVMLAEKIAGSEAAFAARMNMTAKRLGMTRTHYDNANGLPDDGQLTTARDLALLARALWKEFPEYAYLYALPSFKLGRRRLTSFNSLLRTFEGADGMKTGFICDSGYNIVASATRNGQHLIAVVLGAESSGKRKQRAAALLEYGFKMRDWKALFSPRIDQLPMENAAVLAAPAPSLRALVCNRRRAHRRRRKVRRKKSTATAEAKRPVKRAAPANIGK